MPISQMKEVRLREVTWLVHKHTAKVQAELGLRPTAPAEGNRLTQHEDQKPASQRAGSFDSPLLLPGN